MGRNCQYFQRFLNLPKFLESMVVLWDLTLGVFASEVDAYIRMNVFFIIF